MNEQYFKEVLDLHIKHIDDKFSDIKEDLTELKSIASDIHPIKLKMVEIDKHIENHDKLVIDVIDDYLSKDDGLLLLMERILKSQRMKIYIENLIDNISNEKTVEKVGTLKGDIRFGIRATIIAIVVAFLLLMTGLKK